MKIKVRAACVVDEHGGYNIIGWQIAGHAPPKDSDIMKQARDPMSETVAMYFIEAEVETAQRQTIQGKVEQA